jgi:hypothetical protein
MQIKHETQNPDCGRQAINISKQERGEINGNDT